MPFMDGTGPLGKGPGSGRGLGVCAGAGRGFGRGAGSGRGNRRGMGIGRRGAPDEMPVLERLAALLEQRLGRNRQADTPPENISPDAP